MKYTDLYNYQIVPAEVKDIIAKECAEWDAAYGYTDKNYSNNQEFQLQIDTNASLAEDQTMEIISSPGVVKEINDLLVANGLDFYVVGIYSFNDKCHGEIYNGLFRISEYTWCDFVRTGGAFDQKAAWTIETKATKTSAREPSGFHKADVVCLFYLDTGDIHVLASSKPRKERTDSDYKDLGILTTKINFKPISIEKGTWAIKY